MWGLDAFPWILFGGVWRLASIGWCDPQCLSEKAGLWLCGGVRVEWGQSLIHNDA